MGSFYDEMPDWLMAWLVKQYIFFVATSAREGHVNVSPKGVCMEDTFHVVNSKTVWYEDLSGSGVETISHLRENGRITVMFTAFDKPPRIVRLFGTGTVHEYGTPEYAKYIPLEKRKPGSRAVILVDIHKVGSSCGYAVPFFEFKSHRNVLEDWAFRRERAENEGTGKGMRDYWLEKNTKSIDGVPGLQSAHETQGALVSVGVPPYSRKGGVGEELTVGGQVGGIRGLVERPRFQQTSSGSRLGRASTGLLTSSANPTRDDAETSAGSACPWYITLRSAPTRHFRLTQHSLSDTTMGQFYDEMPDWLMTWIGKQHLFFVATAPLNEGHVNLSPKCADGMFHVANSRKVWYEDLTGSEGIETISHIRENGRITVMFMAFDKPPRIVRLFGTGAVHEYGTPEYDNLIPASKRHPGSRAVIEVNIYKVGASCGYAVPFYQYVGPRTLLENMAARTETSTTKTGENVMRYYWREHNNKSLDGLQGLNSAFKGERELISIGAPKETRWVKMKGKVAARLMEYGFEDIRSLLAGSMGGIVITLLALVLLRSAND
ncbi:hypothetical protein HDZ31DRAFT_32535 [Schizophyllum fasciatum]